MLPFRKIFYNSFVYLQLYNQYINNMTEEEFIVYSAEMDAETINQDFDEIDLYGERKLGDNDNDDDCNINFE